MKTKTARDIMSKKVLTVEPEMTVHELADFFTDNMITGAPVVDSHGGLLGVVSVTDIVRNDSQRHTIVHEDLQSAYYLHGWEDRADRKDFNMLHVEEDDGYLVRDIMTPLIFKVDVQTTLPEMADVMVSGRIHRLLVTEDNKLVGIVTTLDMLKAIRVVDTQT